MPRFFARLSFSTVAASFTVAVIHCSAAAYERHYAFYAFYAWWIH
jgi:hypothetical protein